MQEDNHHHVTFELGRVFWGVAERAVEDIRAGGGKISLREKGKGIFSRAYVFTGDLPSLHAMNDRLLSVKQGK